MNKARVKFIIYAEFSIFVLLTVLLSVINIIGFTEASDDADRITEMIASNNGTMKKSLPNSNFQKDGMHFGGRMMGPMGPDSPEMNSSLRYFTFAFDKDGNAELVEFRMSAVTQEDAEKWARSLLHETTGWSNTTYRFRVYEQDGKTFVTVIDQARELLPCYRILTISGFGEAVVLIITLLVLLLIGKKLFKPIEEADRKQKQFISKLEKEFKMPLTVINADTELIEKESGQTEMTQSINRQVRKMTSLVKDLAVFSVFDDNKTSVSTIDLSNLMKVMLDSKRSAFAEKGLTLEAEIDDGITFSCDEEAVKKCIRELIENSLRFAGSTVFFSLKKQGYRITLTQINDTGLPSGSCDQVFDRFTRLENADSKEGAGLGLSYVKDIVNAHNGRISARVSNGSFTLKIDL